MHIIKSWNGKDGDPCIFRKHECSSERQCTISADRRDNNNTMVSNFQVWMSLAGGAAVACVYRETLPHKQRDDVQFPEPSGWNYKGKSNNHKYDSLWAEHCKLFGILPFIRL